MAKALAAFGRLFLEKAWLIGGERLRSSYEVGRR